MEDPERWHRHRDVFGLRPRDGSGGPLRRDLADRMAGGVAAGVAARTGLSVTAVRIAFVLLTVAAGGIGAPAYVVGWLLIPAAGADRSIAARARSDTRGIQLAVALATLLILVFLAAGGPTVLLASWRRMPPTKEEAALMEDAANSLRLALEREEAALANQEASALRRSRELQRGFLSRLSHELRTPLTAIRGYASSLMQSDVTWDGDSQQRFLDRIAAESARLGRLVDDLLDFSAIESGVMRLQRDWCDIRLVLAAAIGCLPPPHAASVTLACDEGVPAVWADHDRMEQVFVNLLNNAFGHNPPGTTVHVTALAEPPDVVISVQDDGPGMPPELAAAAFEPGRRPRVSRKSAGAGLGLSIARAIVQAHGGRIGLAAAERGTCFRVYLPVEAEAADPAPAGPPGRENHQG